MPRENVNMLEDCTPGRRCAKCGERNVRQAEVPYRSKVRRDRRWYDIDVETLPVRKCGACGEVYLGVAADREIGRAVRRASGVLYSDEIRRGREELGLSQQQFAELLGAASPTVCRWESASVIQSRLADTMIRVMLAVPAARRFVRELERCGRGPEAWVVQDSSYLPSGQDFLNRSRLDVPLDHDDEPQFALAA